MKLQELLDFNAANLEEKWTKKYKKSINCNSPKGFSQRAHCAARRKRQKGGKTTSNPLNENNNVEIHNYKKLDRILVALCNLVDTRRKKNPDKYGWVAAGLLDPRNRLVIGFSTFANDKWYHAERLAMRAYRKKYGSIPDGCIIVTTCSPCSEQMPRYGESCTDLINKSPVKKVYCGYSDTTQSQSQRTFNIMVTADTNIRERCQKFAENFMDWEAQYLDESLRDWFKQKWVRFGTDGKIRGDCAIGSEGEGKPKCLPQRKAWALGKKKRATAARRKRREDPNPEREGKARNVATKESVGSTKLGDLCTIKTNFPDADFWLVRRSDRTNVGTPTKEFSPYHIGIKVTATEQLIPQYLYYMMMHLHNQGYWQTRSIGTTALLNIRTEDVKNIQLALTEHELKENSSCPHCGGQMVNYSMLSEKQDACYYKVKSRYKVWPSAYASGALVQCRKKGAKNWGKSKTNEAAPWLGQGDEPLPTKLYHVTRTRNRLSIRQRGLVPKTKEHDHILRQPGVFGFETFEQAEDWAYYWSQDDRESMDIWEINVQDPNDLTPDPALDIQQDYDAWVIYKPIPAANVRLKFTQRWPEPWGKPTTTVKKIRNLEEDPNETE
jgi:pyrimidine deaminase RibD-like protein